MENEAKEIVEKIKKILFQSDEDKNKHIDYILYNSEEKLHFISASNGYEDIIGLTFQNEKENSFRIPEWDYDIDYYLFKKLEDGYKIQYMTNDTHYGLWNLINELYPDDIENKGGVQNYLQYCFDEGITKEYLDKEIGGDVPNVLQQFDGLTINQTMEYKGYIIEVGDLNYDNPEESLVYIYDNLENYMNGDERETISLTTIGLKKNIRDYINDVYFDNNPKNQHKNFMLEKYNNQMYNEKYGKDEIVRENKMDYFQEENAKENQKGIGLRRPMDNGRNGTGEKIKNIVYEKVDKNVTEDVSQDSLRNRNLVDAGVNRASNSSFFDEKYSSYEILESGKNDNKVLNNNSIKNKKDRER